MFGKKDSTKSEKNIKTSQTEAKNNSNELTTTQSYQPSIYAEKPSKKGSRTKITIKYDVGFSNLVSIRGHGANLNWEKGIPLKNTKPDEWTWETDQDFTQVHFKVLINDQHYESGHDHVLACGSTVSYTPHF